MKKFCCVMLALLPLTASAYPIDVEKHLNGLSVDYTSYATDSDMSSIQVNNFGATDVSCTVVFNNGPEAPRTRRVDVAAGKFKNASAKFNRTITRLRIVLTCTPK
ncbi:MULTISPECIES: 3-phosphoglycerate kinase [unclassified Pseudomonas]|uniref:3-phosphoglycerate kinase n=1 Tax=unclassified Pseudomonas TaxID=196821 RepID=UPI002AC9786D|nr:MULTISPECIES: 3-phosphoglycerate kinase [unclassified Pseudomonas]MEB0047991.1 3-phosphoglycerate kinase [Pseudomonas sp. Dout3]MEB0099099.1 3-phosphoglycerate kinase [Pseudomonas sp. DC1.2]WPX60380.1 3-phosphoglycerate kinase [Pseudomonas sp. DC1.2]